MDVLLLKNQVSNNSLVGVQKKIQNLDHKEAEGFHQLGLSELPELIIHR